ncbi:nucleoside deaminase [Edaphobacter albus]|uniref:nucleoside deaminase n=1 Tax=Edaphobacter sp. 4G125 TaxID=2763071 RepID=UPI00164849BE|nr:nucleoside deaminase [Edaphobacter sp. 4G125]QNI37897.1 nucleoside deaminase [Edaphobacter sp. 4G125]
MSDEQRFLVNALELAYANVENNGRPFGAVVVKDREVLATGVNEILRTNDPTSHAELNAIRAASQKLHSANLAGCTVYASGQPCPMCMAAMRLAGISEVVYAYSNDDGTPFGLSTAKIYEEMAKPFSEQSMKINHVPVRLSSRIGLYEKWQRKQTPNV